MACTVNHRDLDVESNVTIMLRITAREQSEGGMQIGKAYCIMQSVEGIEREEQRDARPCRHWYDAEDEESRVWRDACKERHHGEDCP